MKKSTIAAIAGGIFAVVGLTILIWAYGYANQLTGDAVAQEVKLSSQYSINQANRSDYERTFMEGFQVSNAQKAAATEILKAAFDNNQQGGDQRTMLINMIRQANPYPQETTGQQAALISKLYDQISAKRTEWFNNQAKIADEASSFRDYLNGDLFRRWVFNHVMTMPDKNLQARVNDRVLYGQEALDKMSTLVTTSGSQKAYDTGTDDSFQLPAGTLPSGGK